MKKFFKALALVLALVLVIGAIPASAATSFSLKKDTKILYLGGSQGLKEDGTKCGTTSKYRVSKLINGFDAETMYLKLESSDKKIVKTKDSKRKVYGKKIGEAAVTIYIYDKDNDALLDTLQPTIKVKKNASTITFAVTDANGELVDPTKKFGVNVEYTVTLPRKDADGNFVDTDYRAITCVSDNKADVEITPANDYTTKYTIKFKKAGTFDLVAATYQSKIWNAPILSVPVQVVAGYDAVDAKQVALNAAAVTFDTEVSGLTADNFNAYYEINGTKVYPTAAQAVTCKDEVATVTFLSDFIPGLTYFIEYDGKVAGSFEAANVTADSAVSIEIPAQEFTVGNVGSLSFKILDKNGIDIKSLLGSTLTGILTFELEKGDIDTYITSGYDPQVYIGTVGKSYTVKAVYTWIDANGKEQKAEGSGVVASVAVTPWTMGQVSGLISNDGKVYVDVANKKINSEAKALEHWALNDENVVLQIAVPFTKGSETKLDAFDSATEYDHYEIMSANENIIMIGSPLATGYGLIANKEGSTSIIVYGVKADGTKSAIGAIGVKVEPARKETTFTVTPSKKTINSAYGTDSIEFTFDVKDQYSAAMAGKTVNVEVINSTASTPVYTGATSSSTGKLTVNGSNFTGKGAINLKFSVAGTSLSQTVVIDVGDEADAAVQMLKLSGTTLDTGVKNDTEQKTISVTLEGRTKSGYATTGAAITFSGEARKTRALDSSYTGDNYFYTVAKDGALITAEGANFSGNTFTNLVPSAAASKAATKLAAGTYTVTAYSETEKNGTIVVSSIGTQIFTVTNNQLTAVVTRNDNAESLANVIDASEIASAFTVKFDGAEVTGAEFVWVPNGDKTTASVKTATFTVGNDVVGYQEIVATINDIVRKAK